MKLTSLLAILVLSGCAAVSALKIDKNGYYHFKEQPIEVRDPNPVAADFLVLDTAKSVDFVFAAQEWMYQEDFSVQVLEQLPAALGKDAFVKRCNSGSLVRFIENDRKPIGYNFKVLKTETSEVNGHPAMRGIGVDRKAKEPALIFVTAIMLGTRIVVASEIVELWVEKDPVFENWRRYREFNDWVSTIHETAPNSANGTHQSSGEPSKKTSDICLTSV